MTRQAVANGLGRLGAPVYDDPPRKDPAGRMVPRKPASEVAAKTLRVMVVNDPSAAVRLEAVFALIAIGPPNAATAAEYAKAVAPGLEAMNAAIKKEKDGSVAVWLYVARSMYDEATFPDTLKKIGSSVQDPAVVVRAQALTAAQMLGTRASTLIPQVRDCLNYDEPELLAAAIPALASVAAKDPQAAVPDLEKFKAKTKNDELKRMADEAIAVLSGKKKAPAAAVADAPPAAADPKPMAAEKR
jgi:hypothetical protein